MHSHGDDYARILHLLTSVEEKSLFVSSSLRTDMVEPRTNKEKPACGPEEIRTPDPYIANVVL